MRMIHCADLHLDSAMTANLDEGKARERRYELLQAFQNLISYAASHAVSAILLAGDLFDTDLVSPVSARAVGKAIEDHPEIAFYYLRGNHDRDGFAVRLEHTPENLFLFDRQWRTYSLDEEGFIVLHGLELEPGEAESAAGRLVLEEEKCNIVMLHGQVGEQIPLPAYSGRGIDYLALGHVHARCEKRLDARGIYVYPGCLAGRGFDECGEHGFYLLDISAETGYVEHTFVPLPGRMLHEICVDVSACMDSEQIIGCCTKALAAIDGQDLVKVVLQGALDVSCVKDTAYIESVLGQDYYFLKVKDETTWQVEQEDYQLDSSLRGVFVRKVLADPLLSETQKNRVIRCGLMALQGELS